MGRRQWFKILTPRREQWVVYPRILVQVLPLIVAFLQCTAAVETSRNQRTLAANQRSYQTAYQPRPAANQRSYQSAYQPYNYYQQEAPNYGYDNNYDSRYEAVYSPSTYDIVGSQLLMISGGVYKPDYSEEEYSSYNTGYKPYGYDTGYKYYGNSGSRYNRNQYGQQGAVYYQD